MRKYLARMPRPDVLLFVVSGAFVLVSVACWLLAIWTPGDTCTQRPDDPAVWDCYYNADDRWFETGFLTGLIAAGTGGLGIYLRAKEHTHD